MFTPWILSLVTAALIAMAASHKTPRAWLWIGLGGASFIASSLLWAYGNKEAHPLFAFTADALVVFSMHLWIRERWEISLLLLFMVSVFINLMKLGGFMPAGEIYPAMLEIINWLALLWITGVGLTDLLNQHDRRTFHRLHSRLHLPYRAL